MLILCLLFVVLALTLSIVIRHIYHKKKPVFSRRIVQSTHPNTVRQSQIIERYPSQEEIDLQTEIEKETIVGLSKPIGFWTRKILTEKFQALFERFSREEGYWQHFVQQQKSEERVSYKNYSQRRSPSKSRR